jgi:hypothetical protein
MVHIWVFDQSSTFGNSKTSGRKNKGQIMAYLSHLFTSWAILALFILLVRNQLTQMDLSDFAFIFIDPS